VSKRSTPREIALKTSPILSVLSGIATLILLKMLDALHLWALALLAGLIMETVSFLIIEWSVKIFMERRVKLLKEALSSGEEQKSNINDRESLEDIIEWTNAQVDDIKSLRKKDSFRKEFIGNLAHELKTPLFNIQGWLMTLSEHDLKDEKLVRNFLTKANKNVVRMAELIEDLDTITKLESDSVKVSLTPCNIIEEMSRALENAEPAAMKKNITLTMELPVNSKQAINVLCSPHHMQQVLTNLVANSIHYGRDGGNSTLKLENNGKTVKISVQDDGVGIETEDLTRIFERFYRVDKSRSRHAGGSGLGLSIVKHIIESHGQSVAVSSTPGKGTTFSWDLVNFDWEAEIRNLSVNPPAED
jgi:two-component system phosphate regulon sensor histidine kinase PhoR